VYRRTSGGSYTLVNSLTRSTRSWRDKTTTAGTLYYYEVVAKNAVGSSGPSNEVSATPRA
jgi:hypothetical protein